jgi:hypothetical protein
MIRPYNNIEDRLDKPCENGCGGVYRDTYLVHTMNGKIQCIVCHDVVSRYRMEDETMAKKGGGKEKKGGGKGGKC